MGPAEPIELGALDGGLLYGSEFLRHGRRLDALLLADVVVVDCANGGESEHGFVVLLVDRHGESGEFEVLWQVILVQKLNADALVGGDVESYGAVPVGMRGPVQLLDVAQEFLRGHYDSDVLVARPDEGDEQVGEFEEHPVVVLFDYLELKTERPELRNAGWWVIAGDRNVVDGG
jgi:hypothetical protein